MYEKPIVPIINITTPKIILMIIIKLRVKKLAKIINLFAFRDLGT